MQGQRYTGTIQDAGTTVHRYDTGYRNYKTQGRYRIEGLQYTGTIQVRGTAVHRNDTGHRDDTGYRDCRT